MPRYTSAPGTGRFFGKPIVIDPTATFAAAGVSGLSLLAHTITLSGANPTTYATFYAAQMGAMTLTGTNAGQTATEAATLSISLPIKSTNVAVTALHGFIIQTTAVSTATTATALTINAPTGAVSNYAAVFLGGYVGIGTTAPGYPLEVNGDIYGTQKIYQNQLIVGTTIAVSGIRAYINSGSNTVKGLVVRGNSATQSANLQEWQDYNGNALTVVDKDGNVGIGTATFGTSAASVLGIFSGTEPSTSPADMAQLYSVDLSAGNATLGLRTETATVTEVLVASTHTHRIKINGVSYRILLAT